MEYTSDIIREIEKIKERLNKLEESRKTNKEKIQKGKEKRWSVFVSRIYKKGGHSDNISISSGGEGTKIMGIGSSEATSNRTIMDMKITNIDRNIIISNPISIFPPYYRSLFCNRFKARANDCMDDNIIFTRKL